MPSGKLILICCNSVLMLAGAYQAGSLGAAMLGQRIQIQPAALIGTAPLRSAPSKVTPTERRELAEFAVILDRNVFQAQRQPPPEPDPPPPEPDPVVNVEEPPPEPEAPTGPQLTQLQLVLTGTMVYDYNAFAFIAAAKQPAAYRVYQIGDCFDAESVQAIADNPCPPDRVKVFEIHDREIIILYQGREEILSMDRQPEEIQAVVAAAPKAAPPPPKPSPKPAAPAPKQQAILKPIPPKDPGPLVLNTKAEATGEAPPEDQRVFRFERAYVDEQLANFNQLLTDARVVPTEKDGVALFMFKFIRKGSIYEKLGLKNQDIILEINGFTVDSVPKALKLFETLQSEREIVLKVEREGQPTEFQYYID